MSEMGDRIPDGQTHHIYYGDRQNLQVIDIFESPAQMEAFGAVLMPIRQELGID